MTTWQSNDDVRRDGGAEVAEFVDAPTPTEAELENEARAGDSERRDDSEEDEDVRGRLGQYPDATDLPESDAASRSQADVAAREADQR
jgi:hypothetical protein